MGVSKRFGANAEWFVRAVAEGEDALDTPTVHRLAAQLGLKLEDGGFCAVVQYADSSQATAGAEQLPRLLTACGSAAKDMDLVAYGYIGSHLCVVMVVCVEPALRDQTIRKLFAGISRHSQLPVRLGVGRCYCVEKLSYSRVEAYEALAGIVEGEGISYVDDIYVTRSITTRKQESEKRRVIELFKSGQLEQMMASMTRLTENVRQESPVREGMPYPTSIRRTVVEILVQIMHISADSGVDVEALLDHQDPYTRIFEMHDTPQILGWFSETAAAMYRNMTELSSRTENRMLTQAKKIMEEQLCNPELSLQSVSEKLGITAAYFSAFYIRETGKGFNESVTDLRVEKAKTLLADSVMKISQIAVECGFRSASYFTYVFKRQTGMSPGEFRNRKK